MKWLVFPITYGREMVKKIPHLIRPKNDLLTLLPMPCSRCTKVIMKCHQYVTFDMISYLFQDIEKLVTNVRGQNCPYL